MEWFCPGCCTWTSYSDEMEGDPNNPRICEICGTKLNQVKDGTEYMKEPWDDPFDVKDGVGSAEDLIVLRKECPHATTWELCSYCSTEVVIPAYQESKCPICGSPILPCSMCGELRDDGYWHMVCHDKCPYSEGN